MLTGLTQIVDDGPDALDRAVERLGRRVGELGRVADGRSDRLARLLEEGWLRILEADHCVVLRTRARFILASAA